MNILFITDVFDDTLGSAVIVNQNFISAFKEHNVSLITSEYKSTFDKKFFKEIFEVKEYYFPLEERILHGMLGWKKLCRKLYGQSPRHIKLKRALTKAIKQATQKNKYDCIYALGTVMDAPQYFALSNINPHCYWGLNIHDPFPTVNYPHPYNYKWDSEQLYQRKMFFEAYTKAKFITYPSQLLMEYMEHLYGKPNGHSYVLPHFSYAQFNNTPSLNKLILLHSGSINKIRTPQATINAFLQLIQEKPELKNQVELHFSGGKFGSEAENNYWAQNNIFISSKRVSYTESLAEINKATILIILEADIEKSPFLPGKTADYIQANKPVLLLTNAGSELTRIFTENYAYKAAPGNEPEIKNTLQTIINNWQNNNLQLPDINVKNYFNPKTNICFRQFISTITK
jgi:hypothetical protein